ncbi:hypothetical protein, partial [Weissella cibaria]|uniref:hypothetical protein n=1 Tax=Weissella cibaria TaxID=137591 RepID=UPI00196A0AB7
LAIDFLLSTPRKYSWIALNFVCFEILVIKKTPKVTLTFGVHHIGFAELMGFFCSKSQQMSKNNSALSKKRPF